MSAVNTENARSMGASTTIDVRTAVSVACIVACLLVVPFNCGLECGQGLIPELVEVGAQGADAVQTHLVNAAVAVGPVDDQPGVLEHFEVLGDGRAADGQVTRQLSDRLRTSCQAFKDRAS